MFVHPDSRGQDARAGIGYAQKFEEALEAAILPILAMQSDLDEVDQFLQLLVGDAGGFFF